MSEADRKHYYLGAAKVIYFKKGVETSRHINILNISSVPYIRRFDIGHIQQAAQVRLMKEFEQPSPDINIVDVFIGNIIYLGEMTEEEFNYSPEIKREALKEALKAANEAGQPFVGDPMKNAPNPFENIQAAIQEHMNAPTTVSETPTDTEAPVPTQDEPVDAPVLVQDPETSEMVDPDTGEKPENQVDIVDGTTPLSDLNIPKN